MAKRQVFQDIVYVTEFSNGDDTPAFALFYKIADS